MESNNNPIGSNIRRQRELRHWTQEELAIASGVDVRTVQRAESGRPLALDSLRSLAAAFDTTVAALSVSPDDFNTALHEFQKKYAVVEMQPLRRGADLRAFFDGAMAFSLERIGEFSDEQADAVAELEQAINDCLDIWGDLEPFQRRDVERQPQGVLERLGDIQLAASVGAESMMLRSTAGGTPLPMTVFYVAVTPGSVSIKALAREKKIPLSLL